MTTSTRHSREGLTREILTKLTAWHDSSASSYVLLTWLLRGLAFCELLTKSTCSSNICSIFHQLNTKPNTIKSHRIQGTKLKQLQHFFSRNKANIKHSCKSQLYTLNFTFLIFLTCISNFIQIGCYLLLNQ